MTQSTKQYVDLSDLNALRLDCKACRTSLTLPLLAESINFPRKCPNCSEAWAPVYPEDSDAQSKAKGFFEALGTFRRFMEEEGAPKRKVRVSVQLAALPGDLVSIVQN